MQSRFGTSQGAMAVPRDDDPYAGLIGVLRDLAEHMGSVKGALSLAREFGGQEIVVPAEARPDHDIARLCGFEVARALTEIRGRERITIPLGNTDRLKKNRILKSEGSHAQVARAVGCSVRYVKMVRAAVRRRVPLPLFERTGERP